MKKIAATAERRYDIDWLRIMLIFSVFLFHIGMIFNNFGFHIKNAERVSFLDPIMGYLHNWRMPLLFLVSGVGTYFALGKRTFLEFAGERSKRLLIPLVFGMFFIVPPQVYCEKHAQYGSFLDFIPHITNGSYPEGNFSWHHLWFVLYLFICAMTAIPFIIALRSDLGTRLFRVLEKWSSVRGIFLILAIPLFVSQLVLTPYFPEETHALVDDWAYICYSFIFFLYGYMLLSNKVLIANIISQRRIFGTVALIFTLLFFIDWYYSFDTFMNNSVQLFLSCVGDISIALAIVSYAARYLNHDHPWRFYLNEAIYPFYILHQTAIIVIAFMIIGLDMSIGMKAIIIFGGSLFSCAIIYLIFIRPWDVMRLLFGMHIKKKVPKIARMSMDITETDALNFKANL